MQSTSPGASALYAAKAQATLDRGPHGQPVARALRPNSARSRTTGTRPSRGPWLASGLCCPAGSSLTMASSAPLTRQLRRRTTGFSRPRNCSGRPRQRVPNLLRVTVLPCRLPYPGGPRCALGCRLHHGCGLRPGHKGSASTLEFSRMQSSLDATAWPFASPPQEDVYTRACARRVAPNRRRV